MKLKDLQETASVGAIGAGNIATSTAVPNEKVVSADANKVGMFPVIRRNPKKKIKKNVSESQILNELSLPEIIAAMKKRGIPVDRIALAKLSRLKNPNNITRSMLRQIGLGDLIGGGPRQAESIGEELPIYSGEVFMVINNEDALNLILQKVGDKIQQHENNIIVVDQDRADKSKNFYILKDMIRGRTIWSCKKNKI